jgi:DNA polymerase-4
MDAFYASVELLRRPELKGLPVVIGGKGDPNSRGVVTTASYEARKFGVHSAMPMREAVRLCPDAVFLPADFPEYRRLSAAFKAVLHEVTPLVEDRGIDEVYIDATDLPDDDQTLAARLKDGIRERTGLSCSIGIAPNKLLAKIGSDLQKPDGLTIITMNDLPTRIWPMSVRKIPGIGRVAEQRLAALGVETIGALASMPLERLRSVFGPSYTTFLYESSRGIDERPVVTHREPKSMSRERTFPRDVGDWDTISKMLARLAHDVAADLRKSGYLSRKVGIKLRYANFETHTRETTLPIPTDSPQEIRKAAFACLQRLTLGRRIRLLGVRAGDLGRLD